MTASRRSVPAVRAPRRPGQGAGLATRDGEVTMAGPGVRPPALADQPHGTATLRVRGRDVAEYVWRPDLPLAMSPRPYLHPVRTLAGTTVTDAGPDSHRHQFGISIAVPDVGGHNFWGGRTFVAGHGPAWLDNHGVQRHQRWLRHTGDELAHALRWADAHGNPVLHEQRTITCRPVTDTAWALAIHTRLTNATGAPLPFRSPAALGRPGAGYGGFFWRAAPVESAQILSPAGTGVRSVHGGTAAWLAVTGGDRWTVLFVPGDEATARDRWFVRARDYVGVGSSLAWDEPLVLGPDETIERSLVTAVVDGPLTAAAAAALAGAVRQAP
ncbi:PmoA family protein [Phytohabitans sp. ZYX-F-186]|uniref:PmoA family protein n=1 Tax=Phytohabitans maris TaxID=3071409 RepID=A0ABU0ZEB0_9ACTN|nr:PmoA family protein [Phytohabitans sp. ZYX-F-186]MDQ7905399.1 PmoA family protein [Phytohabitans sp. ZYX-F-186]